MKIVFFIKDSSGVVLRDFVGGIVDWFGRNHEVRVSNTMNEAEIAALCEWADVAWVEWMAEHAVLVSRKRRPCGVLVRLHSYEAYSGFPENINWTNVDLLVCVAQHVLNLLASRVPGVQEMVRTQVVPNALNLDAFPARIGHAPTKKLAWVGTIRHTKNFPLALQCLRALVDQDPEYTLHVAGDFPQWNPVESMELGVYIHHAARAMGVSDRLVLHGNVKEMREWLQDKDVLLSTSIRESFGYAIAEGLATGLKPAIHNFPGATSIWPAEFVFNTVEECRDIVLKREHDPAALREFVRSRYSVGKQYAALTMLLEQLAASTAERKATPAASADIQSGAEPSNHFGASDNGFDGVANYWESRYACGGTSGAGSYGRLARFKAQTLNTFVRQHGVRRVVEIGCGDGAQLSLAGYPSYTGLDISETAIKLCRQRHGADLTKRFFRYEPDNFRADTKWFRGDLVLSLDVIFHIVEDSLFERYMEHLFNVAERYVVIYSSNTSKDSGVEHVKHRKFTQWIAANRKDFELESYIPNEFPFDEAKPNDTSFSDFYIFKRVE
ncbi:glycosyltransferase [Oceanidesulfovibrio marinus]|uniref:Glycosyltransferase n=1 Tax=Oceanidesulfovibrio marinus TaxID=370038 RepID=A0ABX6NAK4_9BACT|nr:glycosyltransferase [Oceanidesulfovibrio marinus]QJT07620.1 glycosyltransferase [Oceanidesulfovibrio marinus]